MRSRRRPCRGRLLAGVLAALPVLATLAAPCCPGSIAAADEDTERALLRRSWAEACGRYDERIDWAARQACNLAWFHAHEKGVWQHNLNPHGAAPAGPSS